MSRMSASGSSVVELVRAEPRMVLEWRLLPLHAVGCAKFVPDSV
jgi:hypothetical protein